MLNKIQKLCQEALHFLSFEENISWKTKTVPARENTVPSKEHSLKVIILTYSEGFGTIHSNGEQPDEVHPPNTKLLDISLLLLLTLGCRRSETRLSPDGGLLMLLPLQLLLLVLLLARAEVTLTGVTGGAQTASIHHVL